MSLQSMVSIMRRLGRNGRRTYRIDRFLIRALSHVFVKFNLSIRTYVIFIDVCIRWIISFREAMPLSFT